MATYVETRIFEGLNAHLATLVLAPVHPIAWPNKPFETPAANRWLRAHQLRAPTLVRTVSPDGYNEHTGIYQVDVMWPLSVGEPPVLEIAGAVVVHFKPKTRLYREGVRIEIAQAWPGPALKDDPRLQIPVSIRYRAFVSNV